MSVVELQTLLDRSEKNMGSGMNSVVKESALEVIKRAYKEGIYVQISSGYRSFADQNALYAKGRTKSGNIVTNAKGGYSNHNFGLAVDYFLVSDDGNTALWTVNSKWRRVAAIGKELGFSWGGDWSSFRDYPHLEMTGGLSTAKLRAGSRPRLVSKVSQSVSPGVSKPATPAAKPAANKTESIVDYLNKQKIDSSFSNRTKLAKQYGISNYSGTAAQNTQLLNKIKSGVPAASTGSNFKAYSGTSVVDFLNLNGIDSSFNNRKKLASQYGVANYTGTASQNTALLNAMQGGNKVAAKPSKSIDQMAKEIINNPKAPKGHVARQKWLGVDNATYQKVRARVNQLL